MTLSTSGSEHSSIAATAAWIASLIEGPVATSIAIFAVAGIGLALLTGVADLRRIGRVAIGIFLLFGAPALALGLSRLGASTDIEQAQSDGFDRAASQTTPGAARRPAGSSAGASTFYP